MMKQIKKTRRSGNSLIVTIDKKIIEEFNIKENDVIEMEIFKVISMEKEIKTYRCHKCEYKFDSNDFYPYCTSCGEERAISEFNNIP